MKNIKCKSLDAFRFTVSFNLSTSRPCRWSPWSIPVLDLSDVVAPLAVSVVASQTWTPRRSSKRLPWNAKIIQCCRFKLEKEENCSYDCWNKRWFDFPKQKLVPRDASEESLSLDIFSVALRWAEASFRIFAQKLKLKMFYEFHLQTRKIFSSLFS